MAAVFTAHVERRAILTSAGHWLDVSSPLREPVDFVMVLGGDAATRPFVAAAIIRANFAKKVLIPRVHDDENVRDGLVPAHHEIIRQVLLKSGIAPERIQLLPGEASSTEAEAEVLMQFLAGRPHLRVAVVTNDFHTRRTRAIFSRICRNAEVELYFVGAPTDGFDASNWWQFEEGIVLYLNEYLKWTRTLVTKAQSASRFGFERSLEVTGCDCSPSNGDSPRDVRGELVRKIRTGCALHPCSHRTCEFIESAG